MNQNNDNNTATALPAGWKTMASAPKDRPILGWCIHEAADVSDAGTSRLTHYQEHAEGGMHCADGAQVLAWGGGCASVEDDAYTYLPDWWFLNDGDMEVAANPVLWREINAPSRSEILAGESYNHLLTGNS